MKRLVPILILVAACGDATGSLQLRLSIPSALEPEVVRVTLTVLDRAATCDGVDAGGSPLPGLDAVDIVLSEQTSITATVGERTFSVVAYGEASKPLARGCIKRTLTSNATTEATLRLEEFPRTLEVTTTGLGSGRIQSVPPGIDCPGQCSAEFARHTSVTLSAVAVGSSLFGGWSGDCTVDPCMLDLDDHRNAGAQFDLVDFSLTVDIGAGAGNVSSSIPGIDCGVDCVHDYQAGTSLTLIATPDGPSGALFEEWSGACAGAGACALTIDGDASVGARFVYPLSVASSGPGTATVTASAGAINCPTTCVDRFDPGTSVTLAAVPQAGSMLWSWAGDCAGAAACALSMNAARSVQAQIYGQWSAQIVGDGGKTVAAVLTDSASDVIVVGTFSGQLTPETGTTLTANGVGIFIVKYSGLDGSLMWAQRYGPTDSHDVAGAALDASGNIYLTGQFENQIAFGSDQLDATFNTVYVAKLSGINGGALWASQYKGTAGGGIAIMGGDVYVASYSRECIMTPMQPPLCNDDMNVRKLDSNNGMLLLNKGWSDNSSLTPTALVVDSTGNVIVGGNFSGTADFDAPDLVSTGTRDLFVVCLRPSDFAPRWARKLDPLVAGDIDALAIDGNNDIYAMGRYQGDNVSFDDVGTRSSDGIDLFAIKFANATGAMTWSLAPADSGAQRSLGAFVDGNGSVWAAGSFAMSVDLGGATPLTSAGGEDVWLARFDGAGVHQLSVRYGAGGHDMAEAVSVAPRGMVVTAGRFNGTVDFGDGPRTSQNNADVFVLSQLLP